jgi:4-amino-4-deoxy-L-arabinose transferase-like glycosyltransferase
VSSHAVKVRGWGWDRWALAALVLLALLLRLPPMLDNRFHSDEALYGYWGLLIANAKDAWLASVSVYKPPLLPYLVAVAQGFFGDFEFSVRLPGLVSGVLVIPLSASLSRALYRDRWVALTAAACAALSPFAILFSATAFTDLPMVAFGLGACVAAARGRPGWAGLLAGLAVASKQTGLAWLPLAVLLQILSLRALIASRRCWLLLFVNCLLVVALVFTWDAVRIAQGAESFWGLGVTGYGGLRFIWPQELGTRLAGWVELARYLFVSPVVNGALLLGLPMLVWRALTCARRTREALADLLLVSFVLAYFLLHCLWAFPIWDRYLLPLAPILAVLLGHIVALSARLILRRISRWSLIVRHPSFAVCYLLFVISLAFPAWNAAHSRYPVGGDHGAYDGIDRIAAFLNSRPEGTVVYQHWLGWVYNYYLFGGPISLAHWPTPSWLARDVQAFGVDPPRYITFPSWESSARAERALADVGYGLKPVLATTRRDGTLSFTLYQIQPLSSQ